MASDAYPVASLRGTALMNLVRSALV
jgi:hypothetical protein